MRMVHDHIDIDASPERVWQVFTDFRSFPSWNPFIRKMKGELLPGRRLRITLRLGRRMLRFRPRVTVVRPARELRWLARQRIPRLFDVERGFEFEPRGPSRTRFVQFEIGRGLMAPIVMPIMRRRIAKGYAALNKALKARAEGTGGMVGGKVQ
ncbi:MAG: SRPBCC domain-containing protein [Actinomycetota bacterium]|nr:SRPBCC domain-containing protein [Actinomycetota bacterium]MDQ6945310.1 SRPBCC domain-containing protein [Actinomycetota bacterium]